VEGVEGDHLDRGVRIVDARVVKDEGGGGETHRALSNWVSADMMNVGEVEWGGL
jgi:hypothetical protein